jgi:hypothetical protein
VSNTASIGGAAAELPESRPPRILIPHSWIYGGCLLLFLLLLAGIAAGPIQNGIKQARYNAWMQQGRTIGQCMFSYATNNVSNGNAYPTGNSSTEVFQKLLDGGYATDPTIFYIPMPGKIKPIAGQKLKPENVCWDVTAGVDSNSSDTVPLIFLTGYKVNYAADGAAVPLMKPYPVSSSGIAVFYRGNNVTYIKPERTADGTILNFVSQNFKSDGHQYRQLTPDGVLR